MTHTRLLPAVTALETLAVIVHVVVSQSTVADMMSSQVRVAMVTGAERVTGVNTTLPPSTSLKELVSNRLEESPSFSTCF